jgi:cell fate regulator YaaT (PSP1 superfamily)
MSCNKRHIPDIGRGCTFCDCGEEISAQASEGCYKLHENDWLEEYPNNIPTDIFEVRFKNTRRSYYQNVNNLELKRGDIVAVEAQPGHDIGIVSLTGDMVAKQMRRVGFNPHNGEFKKIYRKARPYDIERWQEAIALEHETMIASRQIAADMGLNMKIGDVEYQGDKLKAIFYYIADERVDFRELIKVFAERFHIRIEMKQIGARQEAGRIGGIGACGRELCCASWISSFSSVTTNAARMQEISLNPQKLAGQCSKLKCCLMYEYDVYADARRTIPRLREPLQTLEGEWFLVKIDPLAGTMSFSTSKGTMANLTTLSIGRVREIIALNRAGEKAETLVGEGDEAVVAEPTYRSEEDSITRFDNKNKRNKRNKRRGNRDNKPEAKEATAESVAAEAEKPAKSAEAKPEAETKEGGEAPRSEHRRNRNNRRERDNREGREPREPRVSKEKREGAPSVADEQKSEGAEHTGGERTERRGRNQRGRRHGGERRHGGGEKGGAANGNNTNNSNNE